jgi:hypothetical protein
MVPTTTASPVSVATNSKLTIFIELPFLLIDTSTPSVTCLIFRVAALCPAPHAVSDVAINRAVIVVMVRRRGTFSHAI